MVGVVLVTHGNLGKELLSTAAFIIGDIPAATALSITASESAEEIRERMSAAIMSVDSAGDGVIILTDMFGGTPANVALSFLDERRVAPICISPDVGVRDPVMRLRKVDFPTPFLPTMPIFSPGAKLYVKSSTPIQLSHLKPTWEQLTIFLPNLCDFTLILKLRS